MDKDNSYTISFGAFDSELKGWEYTIPEGMEAEIKNGKIIVREKESEDERIRKAIINIFATRKDYEIFFGVSVKDILAWLEKQGDYINFRNKIKIGDEVTRNPDGVLVNLSQFERLAKQGSQNLANSAKTCKDEPKFKVGDVIRNKWSNRTKTIIAIDNSQYTLDDGMPAQPLKVNIKAQDNWEFVEQNHAWSEDEKPLLEKFKQAVYDCAWGKVTCKAEGETKEEYANRWAEHFLLMVRDWADDYIDYAIQQKLRKSYDKGKEDTIKTNSPAWSEEDIATISRTISIINWAAYGNHSHTILNDEGATEVIERLKSLKERYTWKPSDEQIKVFEHFVRSLGESGYMSPYDPSTKIMYSLLDDLKKLKG